MTLALQIADNQDSTGATATVVGADLGTPLTIYTSPLLQGTRPLAWSISASIVYDGNPAPLSVMPGYYFAYAAGTSNSLAAISPPLLFVASRHDQGVYDRILLAAQGILRTVTFDGLQAPPGTLPAERVYKLNFIDAALMEFPAIVVTQIEGGQESVRPIVNERDDLGWPFAVTIVDRRDAREPALRLYTKWREQISRRLRYQRMPVAIDANSTNQDVYTVSLEPRAIAAWNQGQGADLWFTSTLGFRAWIRDPRGV